MERRGGPVMEQGGGPRMERRGGPLMELGGGPKSRRDMSDEGQHKLDSMGTVVLVSNMNHEVLNTHLSFSSLLL